VITRLSFIRHGLVHNPHDIYYGRLPRFPLSPEGQQQAQAAGQVMRHLPLTGVYSGPLLRARQTAQAVRAYHPRLPIRISRLLHEIHTPFDGCPREVVEQRHWDLYTGSGPEYEQPEDVLLRTLRFVAQVRRQHNGGHIAAATHGDVLAWLILWAKGVPARPANKSQIPRLLDVTDSYPAPASIITLEYRTISPDEIPDVTYLNPCS
jgi:broad specificity phosphatase PhoE